LHLQGTCPPSFRESTSWIISPSKFWTATIFLHAHLQVVYYNCVKFHKTPISRLGGVALTVQLLLNSLLDFYETLHICNTLTADVHQGLKLRKYFRGQVGPYQINFGRPHNLLGAHQACIARLPPCLQGALWQGVRGPLKAPISPGINGVKSCILAISWQQNWPFRNYNLIQKIKNVQNKRLRKVQTL
jgi:hypothetical protein